ncbi:MAG TPA: choice-of-anchor J domain-containing protein, partial [Candidatus Dormibacteraeota bacterium]|nr:choice-of-anchor J domain-containing protein [Candidatus Dormibacteraeota bacterium]
MSQVISNYVVPATGTYYVRLSGDAGTAYSVVVTRNSGFDTESNDSISTPQNLAGNKGALGFLGTSGAAYDFTAGAQGFAINNAIRGSGAAAGLWHVSTRRGAESGHSAFNSFYYGSESTGTYDTGAANAGSITSPSITLPSGSPTLSFNYVLQTEGTSSFDVASVQISTNNFATSTTLLTSSNASLPFTSAWQAATANLSAFAGQTVQVRFLFDTLDDIANGFEGWYVDDVQVGSAVDDDWYSFNVVTTAIPLRVETSTPSDGSGAFVNVLNPHIELYSPSNVLIASGSLLPDGRNEFIQVTPSVTGTYKVRVTAEGGTSGEYFLSNALSNSITPLIAENPPGSLVYDRTLMAAIGTAGQVDTYSLAIDPGQTVTVVIVPLSAGLQPSVQLFDPSNASLGTATAAAAGQNALLQTIAATSAAAGSYRVVVNGANSTTGGYSVQVILNAAAEREGTLAGVTNDDFPNAQDLDPALTTLQTGLSSVQRVGVLGQTEKYGPFYVGTQFTDISTTGNVSTATGDDAAQTLTGAPLNGFTFRFYGTEYSSISFSTNGLITFSGPDVTSLNTNLSSSPTQAAVAALWDDLFNPATGSSQIYWQALSSYQLIIQWNNVREAAGSALFTFEAILNSNGQVLLNYGAGVTTANVVGSATAGLKAPNGTAYPPTLFSFNQAQGFEVGPNQSISTTSELDTYKIT